MASLLIPTTGAINAVAVLGLSVMLADAARARGLVAAAGDGLGGAVVGLARFVLPALQVYAAAFLLIPLLRWAWLQYANSRRRRRNEARRRALRAAALDADADADGLSGADDAVDAARAVDAAAEWLRRLPHSAPPWNRPT